MKQKIKIYFRELDPEFLINLDQPAFYSEFTMVNKYMLLPRTVHEKINTLYIQQFDHLTGHWSALTRSISSHGIIYPVVVGTGIPRLRNPAHIPPYLRRSDTNHWLVCENSGGGRLLLAQSLGIKVPCIINDRVDLYLGQKEIKLRELVQKTHGLKDILITPNAGIEFPTLPRIHLPKVTARHYAERRSRVIMDIMSDYLLPELRNL